MNSATRSEIEQLYAELALRIDASDSSASDLFLEDGVFSAPGSEIAGRAAIAKHVANLSGAITRHCMVNVILSPGGPDECRATATGIIFVNRDGNSAIVAADYKSHFFRTKDGWKIKRHEVSPAIRVPGAATS